MVILPAAVLAVIVGIVLAAVDGPYAYDKARTSRLSLLVVVGAATMAAGGALVMQDWLPG